MFSKTMDPVQDGLGLWDDWLHSSLAYLRKEHLLRTLRPTVCCNSSSEALIHRADLEAWIAGQPPVVQHYDHCGSLAGSAASTSLPSYDNKPYQHVVQHYSGDELVQATSTAISGSSNCCCPSDRQPAGQSGPGSPATAAAANTTSSRTSSAPSPSSSSSPTATTTPATTRDPADPGSLVRLRLFSLNDYLGLASHPEVAGAAARAAAKVGLGPRSSGVVAGYTHSHRQLEQGLARLKGTEEALLLPTGFAANLAAITCLAAAAAGGG
ncbi:hypothetical protein Agub_g13381, partial [Astrephomene gubernaculifera]